MGVNEGAQALATRVTLDGANRKLPGGYAVGAYTIDQQVFDNISSGLNNLFGGAANNLGAVIMPADYFAVAAFMNLVTAPGTGPATISIGPLGATTGILNAFSVLTTQPTGWLDLTTTTAFTGAVNFGAGNQGDVIVFSTNGGGTASGSAIWGCIIALRG